MKIVPVLLAIMLVFPNVMGNDRRIVILSSDDDAFYTLIATSLSFHLGKKPVLIFHDGIERRHEKFIRMYGGDEIIVIGRDGIRNAIKFYGDAINVSLNIAKTYFKNSEYGLIVPYDNYTLSLISIPIACYLNAPVLLFKNNADEIANICREIGIKKLICIGNVGLNGTHLYNENEIYSYIKSLHDIKYIAVANPSDIEMPDVLEENVVKRRDHITNLKIWMAMPINIFGSDEKSFFIDIPDGTCMVEVYAKGDAMLQSTLYDENGVAIAYSNSMAFGRGKNYMECIIHNMPGKYRIEIKAYNGIKSGFFWLRGYSFVNTDVFIKVKIRKISCPSYPRLHISKLAPLLACSHDGMIILAPYGMEKAFKMAGRAAGGGWCNVEMQHFINDVVNESVEEIAEVVEGTNATAIALMGDAYEIPMYYYPMDADAFTGYGIPSDVPYMLNYTIAVGRIVAMDDVDASLMIARSIFYDALAGEWRKKFNFIFGEGFGETGGIFHQIPYSQQVRKLGFDVSIYGDLRNDRTTLERLNAFNACYIEYEGHGDWFWMPSNLYTNHFNNVDAFHAKNYSMNPSVFLTAACLMGRIDGVPLNGSISMAFIHAGCTAFIGATRETGKEAVLEIIEDNLLKNDTTIGYAFLKSKIREEMPTKVARVLYGDPFFNPYP